MRLTHRLLDLMIRAKAKPVLMIGPNADPKDITAAVISYNNHRETGIQVKQSQCIVLDPVTLRTETWQRVWRIRTFPTGNVPKKRGRPRKLITPKT